MAGEGETEAISEVEEFEAIRRRLGWTQAYCAQVLDSAPRALRQYLASEGAATRLPFPARMMLAMRAMDALDRVGRLNTFLIENGIEPPTRRKRRTD